MMQNKSEKERFSENGEMIYDFGDEFLVVCPKCQGMAKIVSVADTFDAMTTNRPYQKGMDLEVALNRIRSFVGTRYDGKVVEALVKACYDGAIRPVTAAHPKAAEREETQVSQPKAVEMVEPPQSTVDVTNF